MITVQIPAPFRKLTGGASAFETSASTVAELFDQLAERFPDVARHLRDETGRVRRFLNVYVNEEDIRFLGGDSYRFRDGDTVMLVPAIAGGAPEVAKASVPAKSANEPRLRV